MDKDPADYNLVELLEEIKKPDSKRSLTYEECAESLDNFIYTHKENLNKELDKLYDQYHKDEFSTKEYFDKLYQLWRNN